VLAYLEAQGPVERVVAGAIFATIALACVPVMWQMR
jgi:hypothetical protein